MKQSAHTLTPHIHMPSSTLNKRGEAGEEGREGRTLEFWTPRAERSFSRHLTKGLILEVKG